MPVLRSAHCNPAQEPETSLEKARQQGSSKQSSTPSPGAPQQAEMGRLLRLPDELRRH